MAQKQSKSQAEKAAQGNKAKPNNSKKVTANDKNKKTEDLHTPVPVRLITSVVCLALFVLFMVIFLKPEGEVIKLLKGFILGLIGSVSFYVAIPALLYLFSIQAFSGKRPVKMRSISLICFVILCGCLSQIFMDDIVADNALLLKVLFDGGATGQTAGLLCGGIAWMFKWLFGSWISGILFSVAAVMTLLATFQITIPSIIRAVQNRPRADWEDQEQEEVPEPAAVVVNHIANKRIDYVEQKRRRKTEQAQTAMQEDDAEENSDEVDAIPTPAPKPKINSKASEMMRQIDGDVESPVAAANQSVNEDMDVELILNAGRKAAVASKNIVKMNPVPTVMPAFEREEDVLEEAEAETVEEQAVEEPVPEPIIVKQDKVTAKDALESAAQVAEEIAQAQTAVKPEYCYPPIDLLTLPPRSSQDGTMEMRENSRRLNETLASFKIEAHIINVTRGPSVTRYEVELEKGVRLNKLTTVADDIALSLGASGVRIAAVPGKISVVGIEVPNRAVTTVSLREVIDSSEFSKAKSKSSFAVGKDIGGSCIVGNIAKLPHMLIAGTTGSGKSVCMNSIIISLLYKASPEDVKLIMVDPKMVELGIYNGIPHLLIPVVTDPKKAAGSLQWAVTEMMRRYKAMSDAGVRDLESYNSIVESEGEGQKLPQVVVIIDELADLMLVAAKEVEGSICRIAQMGRAAGIHLIIATQRPSADVITGLMKANIPSRIAFAVASAMESRIILDTQGAEKLVGRGDMLFAPIGTGKPVRVQGCFVSDEEVEDVASYVKQHYITDYDESVMEEIERKAAQAGNSKPTASDPTPTAEEMDGDEMLPAAVDVILETGQASVSMLQRRLKLGYARAARIVDEMEEKGIVGPFQGSKPRTILITKEQWEVQKGGQSAQMDFDDLSDGVPEDIY